MITEPTNQSLFANKQLAVILVLYLIEYIYLSGLIPVA